LDAVALVHKMAASTTSKPGMQQNNLASFHARKRAWFLLASALGLLGFVPLYFVSLAMLGQGWVTTLFPKTVLWCLLPFVVAVRLHYKSLHLPAAELRMVLPINTLVPFFVLVLGFALSHTSYSRGAVALSAGALLLWFVFADRWSQRQYKLELLMLQPSAHSELTLQLGEQAARAETQLAWTHWPDAVTPPPACDGVLLSSSQALSPLQFKQLAALKQMHVRIYSTAAIGELLTGRIGDTVLQNPLWQPDGNPAYDIAKRLIDLTVVLATAPAWLPLGALVAVAVKLDSAGPAVFSQWRTGQHGRPFQIHKFRTMVVQAQDKAQFAQVNDKRITRLGQFLRKSRLDEIPQLVNVLLGHMSLIGPRPEQHTFVNDFAVTIPSYPYRHLVRPGITGWAQVMQGYAASAEETSVKLSYDLYYVKHYSLALDLLIVAKTIRTVLTGFGAR
jgi:lipopolysaccharide/colanic/teichoic acid biosynthesis glycosyltransferase